MGNLDGDLGWERWGVMSSKTFKVATFARLTAAGNIAVKAYIYWFNESWDGCIVYEIDATNRTEAKKIAIQKRKDHEAKGGA